MKVIIFIAVFVVCGLSLNDEHDINANTAHDVENRPTVSIYDGYGYQWEK